MYELNKELSSTLPHPNTTYIACVAKATIPAAPYNWSFHIPSPALLRSFPENFVMVPLSLFLGFFGGFMHHRYGLVDSALSSPSDFTPQATQRSVSDHVTSDGVVSVAGQRHPVLEPASEKTYTTVDEIPFDYETGTWHHIEMPENWNHIETMKNGPRQLGFFSSLQNFLMRR
jgi:hypothetical protein